MLTISALRSADGSVHLIGHRKISIDNVWPFILAANMSI